MQSTRRSQFLSAAAAVAVLLACCCCLSTVDCQLTFSPDWGKRSGVGVVGGGAGVGGFFDAPASGGGSNCKTSNEMLLEIFRFVQAEAQLFLDCKHRE